MTDTIKRIEKWFDVAGCSSENPKGFIGQLKVHFEEVQEMVHAIGGTGGDLDETLTNTQKELTQALFDLNDNSVLEWYSKVDRKELLDSLADQIVTAIGLAGRAGLDISGALSEVAQSNESKFHYVGIGDLSDHEWEDLNSICKEIEAQGRYKDVGWERQGEWIVFKDGNGKIVKNPRTYREPELSGFIGGE